MFIALFQQGIYMDIDAIVTRHANKRIRERVGISKSASKNLAKKVLKDGLDSSELEGKIKEYVDKVSSKSKNGNNIKFFNDKIYIFANEFLLTVIPLPKHLMKVSLKLRKRIKGESSK
jgi:hypothetical protein